MQSIALAPITPSELGGTGPPNRREKGKALVLGIFISEGNVLFIRTPLGKLHLPGGIAEKATSKLTRLRFYLEKYSCKKTGESLGVRRILGRFTKSSASRDGHHVYVFELCPVSEKKSWKPTGGYTKEWIPFEDALTRKDISSFIQEILHELKEQLLGDTTTASVGKLVSFSRKR